MIIVLSPAKSLDLTPSKLSTHTLPALRPDANKLAKILKTKKVNDLKDLMSISEKLALINVSRYSDYRQRPSKDTGKRALDTFVGDVYRGLDVSDFNAKDYQFAQGHLRILSGLYGVLRPLDLMQAYRLEMGTRLTTERGDNLYEFWGTKITIQINKALREIKSDILINLASQEYFKSIQTDKLKAKIITPNFKEYRGDKLKFIAFSAKVARGMVARYIIKNRISDIEDIKGFADDGYTYSEEHSSGDSWIFVR